ncbi:MAG: 23S rRNA (pseudouridine(1915)-N(3))-methyltransferase RlmH [Myxococcales bacterium]|nr:23S rRNA (pseudouridine(1915)-N(3))-methyltransferase RlmH [Myxococcales bacterium]
MRLYWPGPTRLVFAREGVAHYAKLLRGLRPLDVVTVKESKAGALADRIAAESVWVALDAGGEPWDSRTWADRLRAWESSGLRAAAFTIGGPDGLGDALLAKASARVSFGAATFPHDLARVMLVEQLYRGFSILDGLPYHR